MYEHLVESVPATWANEDIARGMDNMSEAGWEVFHIAEEQTGRDKFLRIFFRRVFRKAAKRKPSKRKKS